MSAVMLLDSPSQRFPATSARRTKKPWPTMYDLPSEDPEEPGLPDIFHDQQPQLLKETFCPPHYSSDEIFTATDLNLYYDRQHKHWHKRPDWFVVLGVSRLYEGQEPRSSYVLWDELVTPFLVVELLSDSTADEDMGRRQRQSEEPPLKWEVYEQLVKIPYYVVFSRHTDELHLFKLTQQRYVEIPLLAKKFWFPEVQLGLGLWKGVYDDLDRQWLRWYDAKGRWIPSLAEQVERERHRAERERQRAEQAEHRAERAKHQAEQAKYRTEQAEHRAAQLAAKLRTLGIDPEVL